MCTTANQGVIDSVISEWVGQQRAFTAFEVSLEAKKRGANERHRDMRNYIHQSKTLVDEMEFGDYQKTLVPVGDDSGHMLQAFLYHHNTYDATNYQPLNRKKTTSQIQSPAQAALPPASASSDSSDSDDADDAGDDSFQPDYRNRVLVPTQFLRAIGLNPGDDVFLVFNGSGILLQKDSDPRVAKSQKVERNGDIRLSLATLKAAGLDGNQFKIGTAHNGQAIEVVSK